MAASLPCATMKSSAPRAVSAPASACSAGAAHALGNAPGEQREGLGIEPAAADFLQHVGDSLLLRGMHVRERPSGLEGLANRLGRAALGHVFFIVTDDGGEKSDWGTASCCGAFCWRSWRAPRRRVRRARHELP